MVPINPAIIKMAEVHGNRTSLAPTVLFYLGQIDRLNLT